MTVTLFKATIDDANIVGPIFDLYRIFYKQESNVKSAIQYIKSRLENNEAIIFFVKDKDRCIYVMRSLLARNCPTNIMYIKTNRFKV